MTSELFISLYLDEDVPVLLARLLSARGFSVQTAVQAGQLGADDEAQLVYAASQGMAILTHNRVDFERLAIAWVDAGREHAGIILAVRRPVHDLAARVAELLNTVTADEMANQVRYI